MVNPGSFPGSRGEFIHASAAAYAEAVKDNHVADTLANIQRSFLKRYPVTLGDSEEPSQEWLAQVDDDAPDEELRFPNIEGMDKVAADSAVAEYTDLVARTKFKKDQIRRRLHYIYTKNRDTESDFDKAAKDPISSITSKLLGIELKLPRRKTAYNVWGPKNRADVDHVFNKRVEDLGAKKEQHAAIRSAVYKELFEQLPAATRERWSIIAEREHEQAVAEVKKKFKNSLSSSPEDRQRVIAALPKFIEPILDAIGEYTGWKASLIAGGPEPADGGRLNMISIHSGSTKGPIKMDFGRAQKATYKTHIAPAFGTFLKKCYSVHDCRASALPKDHSSISISDVAGDEDVTMQVHTFESDAEHESMHRPKRLFEDIAKSGKSTKGNRPPTGTPSPRVRFTPPLGKVKNRTLPVKDSALVKLGPSPLSQSFVHAGTDGLSTSELPVASTSSTKTSSTANEPSVATPSFSNRSVTAGDAAEGSETHDHRRGSEAQQGAKTYDAATELPSLTPTTTHDLPGASNLKSKVLSDAADAPATSSAVSISTAKVPVITSAATCDAPATSNKLKEMRAGAAAPTMSSTAGTSAEKLPVYAPAVIPNLLGTSNTASIQLSATAAALSSTATDTSATKGPVITSANLHGLPATPNAAPIQLSTAAAASSTAMNTIAAMEPVVTSAIPHGLPVMPVAASTQLSTIATAPTASSTMRTSPAKLPVYAPATAHDFPGTSNGETKELVAAAAAPAASSVTSTSAVNVPVTAPATLYSGPVTPAGMSKALSAATAAQAMPSVTNSSTAKVPVAAPCDPLETLSSKSKELIAADAPSGVPEELSAATAAPATPSTLSTGALANPIAAETPSYASAASTAPFTSIATFSSMVGALQKSRAGTRKAIPATSPPTSPRRSPPASLPPSPQGSPQRPVTPVRFGGAAMVPDLSQIEATPAKGRKRKGAPAGKENAEERASKRVKTAAAAAPGKRKAGTDSSVANKRQRTGGSPAFSATVPAGFPQWADKILRLFTTHDFGPQWRSLIDAWLAFEHRCSFKEKAKPYLSPSGRPPAVAEWIKYARIPTHIPDVEDLDEFESIYNTWWRSLQPGWRLAEGEGLRREDGGDWTPLRCSGINGILSAIAALFFWGYAALDTSLPAWDAAVDDALYALQELGGRA